jgi:hypothetical protein
LASRVSILILSILASSATKLLVVIVPILLRFLLSKPISLVVLVIVEPLKVKLPTLTIVAAVVLPILTPFISPPFIRALTIVVSPVKVVVVSLTRLAFESIII